MVIMTFILNYLDYLNSGPGLHRQWARVEDKLLLRHNLKPWLSQFPIERHHHGGHDETHLHVRQVSCQYMLSLQD